MSGKSFSHLVVVGSSAAGIEALSRLVSTLPLDVEDHRLAEEALRESDEQLRTVVKNAPVVLFAIDREGVFTFSQGRGLESLGLEPNEVVGRSVFEVYAGNQPVLEDVRRALGGEAHTGVKEVNGLIFETGYASMRDRTGKVTGVIGVATDVTEHKEAEEQREQSLARKRRAHAEAEERKRISRELRDRVAHSMGVVNQSLEIYEAFKERSVEQAEARMQIARETNQEACI